MRIKNLANTLLLLLFMSTSSLFAAVSPQVSTLTPIGEGISTPVRLVMDQSGYIYVSDPRAGGVVRLNMDGNSTGDGGLIKTELPPLGLAVTKTGDLLVTQGSTVDVYRKRIDKLFSKISSFQPTGGFQLANGLALSSDGSIFVSDSANHKVYKFDSAYIFVKEFGNKGSQNGEFNLPTALAFDRAANQLLVVDTLNGRIQFFDMDGNFVKFIGAKGVDPNGSDTAVDSNLYFHAPQGVALEYSKSSPEKLERIYVADSYQSRVQVVDPAGAGRRLRYIGDYGITKGKLLNPSDLIFEPINSRIIVANGFGNLVPFGIDGGVSPSIDTLPILTINRPNSLIRSDSFTLSGRVDKPAFIDVAITKGSASLGTVTFSTTTDWTLAVAGLGQGVATEISLTPRNSAGNGEIKAVSVQYNPLAPELAVTNLPKFTFADSVTVTGTNSDGVVITATAGTTVSQVSSTSWSATVSNLVKGENRIDITAASGDVSTTANVIITKTEFSPLLLPDSSVVKNPLQTVSGTVEGVEQVLVTLNGGVPVVVPVIYGRFSTSLLLNSFGANSMIISALDPQGLKVEVPRSITLDPSAPQIEFSGITSGSVLYGAGSTISSSATPTISGSTNVESVTVKLDGTDDIPATFAGQYWSAQLPASMLSGQHYLLITANDTVTQKSSSQIITFNVSSASPSLSLKVTDDALKSYISDAAISSARFSVSGNAAGAVAVDVALNGNLLPVDLDATTGNFTVSIPVDLQNEGAQEIVVTAYSSAGTASQLTRTFIYTKSVAPPSKSKSGTDTIFALGTSYVSAVYIDSNGVAQALPITSDGKVTITSEQLKSVSFVSVSGASSRNGSLSSGSGEPSIADVLKAMKILVGIYTPTEDELLTGDVAPLLNGAPTPDGKIDAKDVVTILYRVVGKIRW